MWRQLRQGRACEAIEVLVGVEAWLVKPAVVMVGDVIVARVVGARIACHRGSTQTALLYLALHVRIDRSTLRNQWTGAEDGKKLKLCKELTGCWEGVWNCKR